MPFLNIRLSKKIDEGTRNVLQQEIGKIMPTIPGKSASNTLISFSDNYEMYNDAVKVEAVFVDIRLYKNSPEESKKEFAAQLTKIFEDVIKVEPGRVHMNFFEMQNWAVNGEYK